MYMCFLLLRRQCSARNIGDGLKLRARAQGAICYSDNLIRGSVCVTFHSIVVGVKPPCIGNGGGGRLREVTALRYVRDHQ